MSRLFVENILVIKKKKERTGQISTPVIESPRSAKGPISWSNVSNTVKTWESQQTKTRGAMIKFPQSRLKVTAYEENFPTSICKDVVISAQLSSSKMRRPTRFVSRRRRYGTTPSQAPGAASIIHFSHPLLRNLKLMIENSRRFAGASFVIST